MRLKDDTERRRSIRALDDGGVGSLVVKYSDLRNAEHECGIYLGFERLRHRQSVFAIPDVKYCRRIVPDIIIFDI